MDARAVTRTAREYITEIFAGEQISRLCVEEVVYDPDTNLWRVTFSFVRPWDGQSTMEVGLGSDTPRTYKVVAINDGDGSVVAFTGQRPPKSAACCKPQLHSASVSSAGEGSEEKFGENNAVSRRGWRRVWRTIWRFFRYMGSGAGIGSAVALPLPEVTNLETLQVAFIPMIGLVGGIFLALWAGNKEFQGRKRSNAKTERVIADASGTP